MQNIVSTNIKDHNGNTIFEKETYAIDYARVTYFDSQITKNAIASNNNVRSRAYKITWKVNAWETATSGSGVAEYIRQESGIFYDLIPLGGEIDLDSIQVQNENGFLPENEFTYETITNFRNSGRTMLIIKIKEQAQYYNVYYDTVHSWESMADYGRNVLNPVGYETGNEKITNGFADNGGTLSLKNRALYNNLDSATDAKKFIYAEATNNINAITSAVSGLYKKVKSSEESAYSYDTETDPNGTYSYQMRYQNTYLNKSKNLILFDSLENFVVRDTEAGTTKTSGWKGTLKSIDLTQIKDIGIDPVVYISTKENLNLEANHNLEDSSTWTRATENTDLSMAKAIAIDMRIDTKGNEFILDAGKAVTAVLYMQAPNSIVNESNPYTYNNIYINNTLIDDMERTEDYFIHQDFTTVKYHIVSDINLVKVNAKNEEEKIKGITFRLTGTSNYGTEVDKLATSDKDGNVKFKKIEVGNYILQEYEATPDWVEDHTEHKVEITKNREVKIDGNLTTESNPVKIKNTPRVHTNIRFYKKDLTDKDKALKGVKFKLEGTSDYGNEVLMYAESGSDGRVVFEDVERGKYTLIETSTIKGYILNGTTYKVLVDENANSDIQKTVIKAGETKESYESIYDKGDYYIYNEPYHSFYFVKKDGYNYEKLGGAKFRLYGCSNTGNIYDETVTSVKDTGFVTFENLESGTYVLKEIEAPNTDDVTYYLDKASHIVEVFEYGKVTLDNSVIWPLSETNNEPYVWNNTRNKGQITITKKWVDNKTNKERTEPVVYISTKKPEQSYTKAYFRTANAPKSIRNYIVTNVSDVTEIKRNTTLSETQVREKAGVTRLDDDPDNENAEDKIYGWVENKIFYWWTEAEVEVIPADFQANSLFYNYFIGIVNRYALNTTLSETQVREKARVIRLDNEPNNEDAEYKIYGWVENKTFYMWTNQDVEEPPPSVYSYYYNIYVNAISSTVGITAMLQNTTLSETQVREKAGVKRIDGDPDNENAKYKIYGWVEDKTLYWWTETVPKVLPAGFENKLFNAYVKTNATDVTSFRRNTTLSEAQVLVKAGVTRLDNDYDNENTEYKIYGWVENKTFYWWTKADVGVLPTNLNSYFGNESSLENIDWTGMYTSGYWTGEVGSEEITESITSMRGMFYGCSSIENLDISWFNNTQITEADNMQAAFGLNYSSTTSGTMGSLKYIKIGENFKIFDTSVLTKGSWKNQQTKKQYENTRLVGIIEPGTYEYLGPDLVKYAVQIYGINQDVGKDGRLGLTFGPAVGANYKNSYVTHTYGIINEDRTDANYVPNEDGGNYNVVIVTHNVNSDGTETTKAEYLTDSSGNIVTRSQQQVNERKNINLHEMSWTDISNIQNKSVFEDCMLCGDTKSVQINLNSTLASGTKQTGYGDGVGVLVNTINRDYRKWNPYNLNAKDAGGYSSSHVRATLIGRNDETDESYAGDENATSETCLYSCIESELQDVIEAKKVKYVTSSNDNNPDIYDKIWLFSEREIFGEQYSDKTEGLDYSSVTNDTGVGYDKFGNASSKYYLESYSSSISKTVIRTCYSEYSSGECWLLRSININDKGREDNIVYVGYSGTIYSINASDDNRGLAFGFCIK